GRAHSGQRIPGGANPAEGRGGPHMQVLPALEPHVRCLSDAGCSMQPRRTPAERDLRRPEPMTPRRTTALVVTVALASGAGGAAVYGLADGGSNAAPAAVVTAAPTARPASAVKTNGS